MRSRDPLILAFIVSVVLHWVVVASFGWKLPEDEEKQAKPLEARLLQFPSEAANAAQAKPKRHKPKQKPNPKPAPAKALESPLPDAPVAQLPSPVQPAPLPEPPSSEPIAATSEPISTSASEPLASQQSDVLATDAEAGKVLTASPIGGTQGEPAPAVTTTAIKNWPAQGCIKYVLNVRYGILNGEYGQAEQCWQHDQQRYSATLKGKAAVIFRQFQIEQESIGRIVDGMLVSDVFREKNDNKNYETLFDVVGGKVKQTRNGEVREVPTGGVALDMLALMQFMSIQAEYVESFDMFVVASRDTVSRVTVVQNAIKPIALPFGNTIARQFHAEARNGELKIDVWISRGLRGAPVRFRIDNQGDILDFQATDVTLDGQRLVHRPDTSATPSPVSPSE